MPEFALLILSAFNSDSAIGDSSPKSYLENEFTKMDLVIEMVIKCPQTPAQKPGYGVISYSRVDKLFCAPNADCFYTAAKAISKTCRKN